MKTINKMSFGFSAVNAGQRNVSVEPQLIATSTEGTFRITPPVSKALGVAHGEYIMFITNINEITNAINHKNDIIVAFCEENGLDINSQEAAIAIHKEFDAYAIAKGIKEYDAKGICQVMTERLTKKDKAAYVAQNFDAMLASAEKEASDEVKAALFREDITKDEQAEILIGFVTPRELPKYKGSKTANPAGLAGYGTVQNFTDSNIWHQIKADLGDDATKVNREFSMDIDDIQEVAIDNGYETVTVRALMLGSYTDTKPVERKKAEDAE